jgi:hypothetical protein
MCLGSSETKIFVGKMQGFWYTGGIYSYHLALNSQENIKFMIHIACVYVEEG